MRTSPRLTAVVLLVAVIVVVAWVDAPVLSVTAQWRDDVQYVVQNPLVLNPGWESTWRFLSEVRRPSTVDGYYQPLAMLSLMLDSAAGGGPDRLRPFHCTGLALHVLNTVLVVVVLLQLFGEPYTAALTGLLFGVHPLTVEPLAWISERKTLLAAGFALASLSAYLRYAHAERGWSRRSWYTASWAGYGLALMAKPTSTPLPLLLLLLDAWPLRRLDRRAMLEKIPYLLLGLLGASVTVLSQAASATVLHPNEQPWARILLTVCHNVVFYLSRIFWPGDLSPYYPFPDPMTVTQPAVLAGVVGTGVLVVLIALSARWTHALVTGGLLFAIAVSPTMGPIAFTDVIAADKYVYLPSLGILVIVGWFLARTWQRAPVGRQRMIRTAICLVVFGLVAVEARATRRYLALWQTSELLYGHVLRRTPQVWMLHDNLGDILADQGRLEDAVSHYRQAIALNPDDPDAHRNLANALFSLGQQDEAIAHYHRVLELQPANVSALYNLGLALVERGDADEAIVLFRRALRADPDNARVNCELGAALAGQGQPQQAVVYYRKSVELEPDLTQAQVGLADTLQLLGQSADAIPHYRLALRGNPADAAVHNNLAVALADQGLVDEAIAHYREAVRLDPTNQDARRNLSQAVAGRGAH